ncbi:MAG TPA: cytochrome c oxidase subunit II [Blastocatellia bacterium]|nr:cytochrome c oxidase subunit II [Blastocatellia bacterium]
MQLSVPFSPEQASTFSGRVDALYGFLWALTILFGVLISLLILYFAVKYRRRSEDEIPRAVEGSMRLEAVWTIVPFFIAMGIFGWGASMYYTMYRPPTEALDIYVVAKQWMWKVQHLDGHREINELHVPVGRKVRLMMTTEDVIHSFFVPAFRTKMDVVPGKYSTVWFEATKPGRYHLFCAEYCGTSHSGMIGWIYVMEAPEYQDWLSGGAGGASLASSGEKLFQQLACNTCHKTDGTGRGPALEGLFGKEVKLQDGGTVTADEAYLRESVLNPRAKVVAGYQPIMPTFQGQVTEEQLLELAAYIKSLSANQGSAGPGGSAMPAGPGRPPAQPAPRGAPQK